MEPLETGDPNAIDPYRPTARIGASGMGVVCLATGSDGGKVAIKLIRSELAADPAFVLASPWESEPASVSGDVHGSLP
jgi:hypothetical protein